MPNRLQKCNNSYLEGFYCLLTVLIFAAALLYSTLHTACIFLVAKIFFKDQTHDCDLDNSATHANATFETIFIWDMLGGFLNRRV